MIHEERKGKKGKGQGVEHSLTLFLWLSVLVGPADGNGGYPFPSLSLCQTWRTRMGMVWH